MDAYRVRASSRHNVTRIYAQSSCPVKGLHAWPTVLDVGAGLRPAAWFPTQRLICIEPHPPYCAVLRDHGYEVRCDTALGALREWDGPAVDAVYLLDVLEHMTRDDALQVLTCAQWIARRQVLVFTPFGFMFQDTDRWHAGGEQWQRHRSGWVPEHFSGWDITPFRAHLTRNGRRIGPHVVTAFYALWNKR